MTVDAMRLAWLAVLVVPEVGGRAALALRAECEVAEAGSAGGGVSADSTVGRARTASTVAGRVVVVLDLGLRQSAAVDAEVRDPAVQAAANGHTTNHQQTSLVDVTQDERFTESTIQVELGSG